MGLFTWIKSKIIRKYLDEIKDKMKERLLVHLGRFEERAKQTPNEIDDRICDLLRDMIEAL